jgi:2-keto-3-deoxy-galactonokinase
VLLGQLDPAMAASFVSGVLIGADVNQARKHGVHSVHVIGEGELAILYAAALAEAGILAVPVDSHAAFVAGACAIWSLI